MFARRVLPSLAIAILCTAASAQRPADVVHWTAKVKQTSGHRETIELSATIQPGWHVYAPSQQPGGPTPMTVKIPTGQPFTIAGRIEEAGTEHKHDPQFDMDTVFFMGKAHLLVPLLTDATMVGKDVPLDVRFQVCNDTMCLPPTTMHITAQGTER